MACNGCNDGCGGKGDCPHKCRPLNTRLMPFRLWVTSYTPVIPKFYWDVYSHEERLRLLCLELDRLRAYVNYVFCELEKLANELAEELEQARALLEQLEERIRQVERLITEVREILQDVTERMDAIEAEFERVKQQAQAAQNTAQAAQATANSAQAAAQAAQNTANSAQATAQAAQATAQAAQNTANSAQATAQAAQATAQAASDKVETFADSIQALQNELGSLDARVQYLEDCCTQARQRLDALEAWRAEVDAQLEALNIATAENPEVSLSNFEGSGQISSGPISTGGQQIYASVLAIDVPLNVAARRVSLDYLGITARIGGNVAFEADNGQKVPLSGYDLIQNGQPTRPEIIDWNASVTRSGIRIRVQFSRPLWRVGTLPNGQWLEEQIMNATPFAPAVWINATVS